MPRDDDKYRRRYERTSESKKEKDFYEWLKAFLKETGIRAAAEGTWKSLKWIAEKVWEVIEDNL